MDRHSNTIAYSKQDSRFAMKAYASFLEHAYLPILPQTVLKSAGDRLNVV